MPTLAIFDISKPLNEATPVYPGDEPFCRSWTCRTSEGAAANVSAVRGSSHAGTHVDLPSHLADGAPMPSLEAFIGPVVVVENPLFNLPTRTRVLIKGTTLLSSDDVDMILHSEAPLVGVETMSIDPIDSDDLPNHKRLLDAGVVILENLDLSAVEAGLFELIALPLKIHDADATWVRAVLRTP
jgi:arylformamidase